MNHSEDHATGRTRDELSADELRRLLRLSERELKLVGLELHDGAAQQISAAVMFLDLAVSQLPDEPEPALASVKTAAGRLRDALQQMRDVILGIHPPALERAGLAAALGELAASDQFPSIQIEWRIQLGSDRLMPTLELAIYRIVRESLHNADRHSGGKRVVVSVIEQEASIVIEVTDDGRGFIRSRVPQHRLGLTSMEQRAELLGGSCQITSVVGGGTTIRAELPRLDGHLAPRG